MASQTPRRVARPRSEDQHAAAFSQLSLFESEAAEVSPAPASLEEVRQVFIAGEALEEPFSKEQEEVSALPQPEQETRQVSAPPPGMAVFPEPGMLAWPFASPPEPLARAIERCVARLSGSSIGGSRDAGFWQLVYLLCAKQAEERHAEEWPKRFFTNQKEAKKEQGAQAIQERILPLFEQVKTAYPGLFSEGETLQLQASTLAPLVLALCDQDLFGCELDPFGAAYQQWAGARAREWRAQFFTPLGVAYFVISLLQPQAQECVLDASCGAGVCFRALHTYRRYYLAGMSTLLEEAGHAIPAEELQQELTAYMRSRVYGADLDGTLIRLARLQLSLLDGDPEHVYHMDSLAFPQEAEASVQEQIPLGSLDLIVGNPPYSLPVTDPAILGRYDLARVWKWRGETGWIPTDQLQKKVPTEVLFMEQALNWLKPGGRMALVVPESLLSNPGTTYARYWLMKHAYLLASISLPGETFQAQSHTGVHTGVLVLRKMTAEELEEEEKASRNYSIFMAVAECVGYDSRGRTVYARTPDGELLQRAGERQVDNDLPAILASFWRFQTSGEVDSPPPALEAPIEPSKDDSNHLEVS
jgi:type I restriction enzyme M protein